MVQISGNLCGTLPIEGINAVFSEKDEVPIDFNNGGVSDTANTANTTDGNVRIQARDGAGLTWDHNPN